MLPQNKRENWKFLNLVGLLEPLCGMFQSVIQTEKSSAGYPFPLYGLNL